MKQAIIDFVAYGLEKRYIHPLDRILAQNQLLEMLGMEAVDPTLPPSNPLPEARQLLPLFLAHAQKQGLIKATPHAQGIFTAKVMAVLTPSASRLNESFWRLYQEGPQEATDAFYQLSRDNDYIKELDIARNIAFQHSSPYGTIELTINLSKPEKDPKDIAAAKAHPPSRYPQCQLCMENEGYAGHIGHPARSNHRIVRFPLNKETWGFQYSPYAYYPEHCIFLSEEHRPMRINAKTFRNLFAIVELFPHYFAGSNADLPIVGGSILSHDHYQGGRYTFPMDKAAVAAAFSLPQFATVQAGILKWPLSVIRLESPDKEELTQACVFILERWRRYSDETADIQAETDGTAHNTVTPIARRDGEVFVCHLVLRNNRTTAEFPDGLFHPHPDVQHIKKENIGLIEVMGLAILPPRLKGELAEVERFLRGEACQLAAMHQSWAESISIPACATAESIHELTLEAVGSVFVRVLEDAGVFKATPAGNEAFQRFLESLQQSKRRDEQYANHRNSIRPV